MKTLILLTAADAPAQAVGMLPALGALTDTYFPGVLRVQETGDSYPLIFSRYARELGKRFCVCADGSDQSDPPDASFPSDLQEIDCLILDLTSEHAGLSETDAKLRDLIERLEESGERCRLLLLCLPAKTENTDPEPPPEPEAAPVEEKPRTHSDLPFLIALGDAPSDAQGVVPADPVDCDTLCRLLFTRIESSDLDEIYEEAGADEEKPSEKNKNSLFASVFDWVEIFCVALVGVILLMTFIVRRSPVEGSSMYPTLIGHNDSAIGSVDPEHGVAKGYDDLLISNLFYTPKRLDIVIIQEPSQLTEPIVKRIIGIGGDTVKINFETWAVYVNGERLDEPYINKKDFTLGSQLLKTDENNCWEGKVPEGCVFVLGDNRSISKDSRTFGFIDERYIIGKVIFRIAPLDRFGTVEN